MKPSKIEFKNGVLVIDDKPYETIKEIRDAFYGICGRETVDQLFAEAYHMYKTDPEVCAKAELEMRDVNIRIK